MIFKKSDFKARVLIAARTVIIGAVCFLASNNALMAQTVAKNPPATFKNPVLTGFNPDPSICRVGADYYMVTSSFTWYPGIPVYHSRDLVNWELIGHGIDRMGMVKLGGLSDNDGIWAVTIRYHDGTYYLITNCSHGGGNFYITAKDPRGPWSDPVWLKSADGVDPSLFWDRDGRCYYIGNQWEGFKKSWTHQTAIWMQELDLKKGKLVGKRKILTYGFASNAAYTEAPHLYRINGKYLLMTAEGGTDEHHAVTVFHSDSLWGPYEADLTNPVLSHRQMGSKYPVQAVGHADLVQTQRGDWFAVCLGKRMIGGVDPLSRETFLCKVDFENGTPIFNPGFGRVRMEDQPRPDLPWTPVPMATGKDDFDGPENADAGWYAPGNEEMIGQFIQAGACRLPLAGPTADSLKGRSLFLKKVKDFCFTATTRMNFAVGNAYGQAGMILYRTADGYFSLVKTKDSVLVIKKDRGIKSVIAKAAYNYDEILLRVTANKTELRFSYGRTVDHMNTLGKIQSITPITDNTFNRFNGPGIGIYASSGGYPSTESARFDWFDYESNDEKLY